MAFSLTSTPSGWLVSGTVQGGVTPITSAAAIAGPGSNLTPIVMITACTSGAAGSGFTEFLPVSWVDWIVSASKGFSAPPGLYNTFVELQSAAGSYGLSQDLFLGR